MAQAEASIITRVFTEKDEIALLQSIISYKSKKGHDPGDNLLAFKNSVTPSLSFPATKHQVTDKIRRLKRKFHNIHRKRGDNPYFSRNHEDKLFQLSKKVWATSDDKGSNVEDCWLMYPLLCATIESEALKHRFTLPVSSKEYVKEVIRVMKEDKATELEEEWKGYFCMQHQVYVKRTELIRNQSEAVANFLSQWAAK